MRTSRSIGLGLVPGLFYCKGCIEITGETALFDYSFNSLQTALKSFQKTLPLATFAGQPTQSIGVSFLKSYAAVCLEGAIIIIACVIFSRFASTPPVVDSDAAPAAMVWKYIGELVFNMLVLVGTVKMSDRIIKDMMGLG